VELGKTWHLAKRRRSANETAAGGALLTVLDIHFEAFFLLKGIVRSIFVFGREALSPTRLTMG
jgi:hypothetical protein